ncbi:large ribosomal subunit protein bL9m [Plodia interpunctella]|uniref:large ribosomal subunit protein bL9m n=1 Tax=Plodia interpunctella TaxID=58824 RepID=UPI00236828C5|nr:39S ribosomal protein L9, mitochondrial [Plodia interpunctella]
MFSLSPCFTRACTSGYNLLKQQTRNTFVLKRRWPPPLHKKGGKLPKMKGRHFVYDLVQDTNTVRQPDVKVILKQFVDGVGNMGDVLSLRPTIAYRDYLMPGLAVYATPEMAVKYKSNDDKPKTEDTYSSPFVKRTLKELSNLVLQITMSKLQPWTLQPWHVKASFRKCGFVVPEHAIEMPSIEIKGPDLTLQEKEFLVTVTINKTEKVNVRCRIHHWATGLDRLPWVENHWKHPKEPLIPEQAPILQNMPLRE